MRWWRIEGIYQGCVGRLAIGGRLLKNQNQFCGQGEEMGTDHSVHPATGGGVFREEWWAPWDRMVSPHFFAGLRVTLEERPIVGADKDRSCGRGSAKATG
jgi:hypothetical protein